MKNKQKKFKELKRRWDEMVGMFDKQQERGLLFEPWLKELFQASGLKAEGSFTRNDPDEELDGAIHEGLTTFLVEAKWKENKIDANPVRILSEKIQSTTASTYGLLISFSGFNINADKVAERIKPIRVFLIDAPHLEALLGQKIDGKTWINTLVIMASRCAKPYIPIEEILNENKMAYSSYLRKLKKSNKHLTDSNPFQTRGTLPEDAPSYIKRECDNELAKLIKSNKKKLIAIHGGFEIGKSSLMMRIMHTPFMANRNWIRCHLDMQPLFPSDMEYFMEYFFKYFNSKLTPKIDSWEEMDLFLIDQPLVLCIEEFGKFIDYPKIAKDFIQNLCIRAQKSDNIRIVVESKFSIEDFFDQFSGQDFEHPKYRRCWENIPVEPFNEAQTKQLLSLLPRDAQLVALKEIDKIKEFSCFKPRELQCLCDNLFDALNETSDISKLIDIINNEDSYS
ncbi:MAG: restriction endonuclease [Candidatus Aminicenantes bacterium]|nr:MAG: restriction endonuclease [Candidatus Aminicenantes bacterium]